MFRAAFAATALIVLIAACDAITPTEVVVVDGGVAGEEEIAAEPSEPAPDSRVAAMQLSCGAESFRVAFEDVRAVVINEDGSNSQLTLLEPSADSEPGVSVYTDGMMTFAKSGGGDTATVIRFARGRMAFTDCAIAVN
jgi:streptogramin lyase